MKKILIIGIVLMFLISFVSAGLLGDVWGKITGKVVDNETGDDILQEEEPKLEEEEPEECPTIIGWRVEDNKCVSDSGCDYDDSEYNYYGEEECEGELETPESPPDDKECEEGEIKNYECSDGTDLPWCGCENGMWVCKISIKDDCPDDRPEPKTCAGEIKITFNKDVYNIGDPVKIIIETFDSQGNHLPNYAFYGQMYDDRWHTPDLQRTDSKGYMIHTGTAEKPAGGVTEIKFKVYTKETGSCSSVEDIGEVKFESGACGIGGCVPEPKPELRPDDGEIFYLCSGCELEDKCYPYGYRKGGSYCLDENDVFVSQLGDNEKCENNFECKTNLCINGNCVSSGVWNKFIKWFQKLFGGGDDEEPKDCSKLLIEKDIGNYEYVESAYGHEDHQVPLYSDDGEEIGIVKCCIATYENPDGTGGGGIVCPFENRKDLENSFYGLVNGGGIILREDYNGEKVYRGSEPEPDVIVWTSNEYIIATGGGPGEGHLAGDVADAYFDKYPNDLEEIDVGDVPPPRPPNSVERCGEIEDNEERGGCYINVAISKSDAEICENIVYESNHRNKCYVNVAEHTGDASICDNVDDDSLREKCYFWAAGETGDVGVCEGIVDAGLQAMCYVEVAEKESDASFCDKITDSHIADKCYRDVGIQTNDRSLCEKIIEDRAKQKCLDGTS